MKIWGDVMTDPRDDLKYDSEEWTRLLALANIPNKELAGILHGFRCCGLRLHKGREGWALRPDMDPVSSAWATKAQYEKDRDKWLIPYQGEILKLLNQL